MLGWRGGVRPIAIISDWIGAAVPLPPIYVPHVGCYSAFRPHPRAISATPLAGSGTKKITSAMTATSNLSLGNGRAIASPEWKVAAGSGASPASKTKLRL